MNGYPVFTDVVLNNTSTISALIDEGCECYAAIDQSLVETLGLPYVDNVKRRIRGATHAMDSKIQGVVGFRMEIGGFSQTIYAYAVPRLAFPLILGNPWKVHNKVRTAPDERRVFHGRADVWVPETRNEEAAAARRKTDSPRRKEQLKRKKRGTFAISVATMHVKRVGNRFTVAVSALKTMEDVKKSMKEKKPNTEADLEKKLPPELHDLIPVFLTREAEKLAPYRPGIDHRIELRTKPDGTLEALPWGPLYGMSKMELLVLRKTLNELLAKGFIRPSTSEAGAPVLFVRKPGGGLRFCVDYRALNAVSKEDRYPLPLFAETMRNLTGAKWFSKVDVISAFWRLRIAKGHEHKTAFRTRYGLFEWLVTPFGLTGAPASFQRFINKVLREYLDDFASAYIDDVLIYSSGSREDHLRKVRLVIRKLGDAGLNLDADKSEFAKKSMKYLGFIVHADGKGMEADPEKVETVQKWAQPQTQKEVRRFLGFANYYRVFIPDYSEVAAPLTMLTGKNTPFTWGKEQEGAFQQLKRLFCMAPVLKQWDPDHPTFLETDCSGFALGGVLSQEQGGSRHPVAYHSEKLNKAEINYDIHDKELLAVIRCLSQWDPELRSCGPFTILTDHKNLEHFMKKQQLSERQARWAEKLMRYKFSMIYRPGAEAVIPDALSRREQDTLGKEDYDSRFRQLIPAEALTKWPRASPLAAEEGDSLDYDQDSGNTANPQPDEEDMIIQPGAALYTPNPGEEPPASGPAGPLQDTEINRAWKDLMTKDKLYQTVCRAIQDGARQVPTEARLKIQLADCRIDAQGLLYHRGKLWVPGAPFTTEDERKRAEPEIQELDFLRTKIIQRCHESPISGHPGREGTISMVGRDFYWPLMSYHVRRFCRNCNACGRNKVWRDQKHGLLQPLPVPDRFFQEISMDFIVDLPESEGCKHLWVIKDRLSKTVVFEAMPTMKAEACAQKFMECWVRHHGFPRAITSDRGTNWTGVFWKHFCSLMGVSQRLSSAYHPQTDGGPERMNQEIQAYLRNFINHAQTDWKKWLPAAQLAINGRYHSAIGTSPFFATHGFNAPNPTPLREDPVGWTPVPAETRAKDFAKRIREVTEICQATMAATNQQQEESANRKRNPAPIFRKGDKVWLDLRNYSTDRPKKKLDIKHAKYTVAEVLSPLSIRLEGIPRGISPVFHPDLLRLAAQDPLPGQESDDSQPEPILLEGHNEYIIEKILCARKKPQGKGRKVLVKWYGYHETNWEPLENMEDTAALDEFEQLYGSASENDGPLHEYSGKRRGKGGGRRDN